MDILLRAFDARYGRRMSAVLLAQPLPHERDFLEHHLTRDGFEVVGADGEDAVRLVEEARPDVVLCGDSDVLDACRRRVRDVPVIVLGDERSDAIDRVRAFARGCDDFLARPFVYDELVARIRAVLRRAHRSSADRVVVGALEIDRPARAVAVAGARVALGGKEYELLLKLASDPSRVFTKEELLREVWGFRAAGRTRTLDSHASRLRRKLRDASPDPFVVNVWGVGYKLLDQSRISTESPSTSS
jgi:DNA-binding response OmpR family regulator